MHPAPALGKHGLLNIPLFLGYAKSAFSMVTESNETGNESVTESNGARITLDSKTQSGQYGFAVVNPAASRRKLNKSADVPPKCNRATR